MLQMGAKGLALWVAAARLGLRRVAVARDALHLPLTEARFALCKVEGMVV